LKIGAFSCKEQKLISICLQIILKTEMFALRFVYDKE
jgi:hypothetical protein